MWGLMEQPKGETADTWTIFYMLLPPAPPTPGTLQAHGYTRMPVRGSSFSRALLRAP